MLDFSEILLPIDLEEPSLPAVQHAAALARRFHGEIVMVHVVEPPAHFGADAQEQRALWSTRLAASEKKFDDSLHEELRGIRVKRVILEGDPATAIAHAALHEGANLIVMGTHGYSGVAYFLVGSVTAKLLSDAQCPVWTVPHPDKVASPPGFRNILCAIGLMPDPQRLRLSYEFAQEFGARLTLAHITPEVQTYAPGGHYDIHGMTKHLTDVAAAKMNELKEKTGIQAEIYISSGDVSKMLDEAARSIHADLLIIGRRPGPGWVGGWTYPIISRAHIPVLSV